MHIVVVGLNHKVAPDEVREQLAFTRTSVEEALSENYPCLVRKIGVNDVFGESGKPEELYKLYGLTSDNIYTTAKKLVKSNQYGVK